MGAPRYVLHLPRSFVRRPRSLERLLARALSGSVPREIFHAFAFRNDEERFVRDLVSRRSHLWVFRSNQRLFCGDFVVVDMSSPDPARRACWVLELKRGSRLRRGRGAGIQLRNAPRAVGEIVRRTGALAASVDPLTFTGDGGAVLEELGVRRP